MINKNILKDFVQKVNDEYNRVNLENDEEVTEVISNIIFTARFLSWRASNITNSTRFPHIKEDIENVIETYEIGKELDEGDIECLIDYVLDFDYSDYNDQICHAIESYIAERED